MFYARLLRSGGKKLGDSINLGGSHESIVVVNIKYPLWVD